MWDKVAESVIQYGLLGIVLLGIGYMIGRTLSWVAVYVIKPMVDNHIVSQNKLADSAVELNREMAKFMNTMSVHANSEENNMARINTTMSHVAESIRSVATQKEATESLAGRLRLLESKQFRPES